MNEVFIGNNLTVGEQRPLTVIAGPCVIESESMAMGTAEYLCEITENLSMPLIYKSSYEKANRSSADSFSGLGRDEGLRILSKVKAEFNVPVLTDVHEFTPLNEVADVVDVLQTPAFLCRQTQFIQNVAACGKPVNLKKGQFLSPQEMRYVVEKALGTGNKNILVSERGVSFGYNNLISDMRSLVIMRNTGCPVVFDATHSVQLPGAGKQSGGQREFIPALARAAVAVGVAAIFIETHPQPEEALSDGATSWPMKDIRQLLTELKQIDEFVKKNNYSYT